MHIPDGYLSPATAGALYAAMLPFWMVAARKLKQLLSGKTIPLMALLSAFCFVIQMINIPLPGGTTGHAVGAGIVAIVLSPWPAVLTLSITLVIQALFFGDGGITAIGANCFNMALVQVFSSYAIYRLLSAKAQSSRGKAIAAGIAGYIGINLAALCAGFELGLQPAIAHSPDGTPLYAPYPLSIAVPAMLTGHLIAGFAEGILSAAAVYYLSAQAPEFFDTVRSLSDQTPLPVFWRRLRTIWIVLALAVFITPLGLLAPGTAWGEWSAAQLREKGLGFVPSGMKNIENLWPGLFRDYQIPGLGANTGYIFSACLGILIISLIFWLLTLAGRRAALRTSKP